VLKPIGGPHQLLKKLEANVSSNTLIDLAVKDEDIPFLSSHGHYLFTNMA